MTLSIDVLTTHDQLGRIQGEWDELLAQSGTSNPFLTWGWVEAWHTHMARGPLEILAMRRHGRLVGIVPFERVRYRLRIGPSISTLQLIGSGETHYERRSIICLAGHESEVIGSALDHLSERRQPWVWAAIDGIPADTSTRRALWQAARARGLRVRFPASYTQRYQVLALPSTWDAFRGGLKRNIKESLRHCYNSLKREGRQYQFEVWDDPQRTDQALEQFYSLHTMRATHGMASIPHENYFRRPEIRSFFSVAASRLIERGILHPCFLRIDGDIAATRLVFEFADELYLYYSGFDPRWWKYSVATTITAECIKWAIGRGLRAVNLSAGTDISKTRWGGVTAEYGSLVVVPNRPLPLTAYRLYSTVRTYRSRRHASAPSPKGRATTA